MFPVNFIFTFCLAVCIILNFINPCLYGSPKCIEIRFINRLSSQRLLKLLGMGRGTLLCSFLERLVLHKYNQKKSLSVVCCVVGRITLDDIMARCSSSITINSRYPVEEVSLSSIWELCLDSLFSKTLYDFPTF